MALTYDYLLLTDEILTDMTYTVDGAVSGQLSFLLDMHESQTVDAFEINRNQEIFLRQGNRNPFIDYPHFAQLIYYI
jgi:endonuclease I